jgi:CRISPR-associated RAMP protein (TIGR02581 family)
MNQNYFETRVRVSGLLVFETAFHIGSGKEGELATDMGVLKDYQGLPVLPGSTLKGCFRATAERLAGHLGLTACLLDSELSGQNCVGDQRYFQMVNEDFKSQKSERNKLDWLCANTCDICKLFGSPLQASRIFFSDGQLVAWSGRYQVRDGVVIDRDSGTARTRLKYDYEVASRGTSFELSIDIENPEDKELGIVAAVVSEWQSGFRIGGFTSRGLGKGSLLNLKTEMLDYSNNSELRDYLLNRRMQSADQLLSESLEKALAGQGVTSC